MVFAAAIGNDATLPADILPLTGLESKTLAVPSIPNKH